MNEAMDELLNRANIFEKKLASSIYDSTYA
jgi:hypothetical protein